MMSKGLLAGLGATLAICAIGTTDASACSRRWTRGCDSYYAPPVGYGYGYGPSYGYGPGYGYVPPAPVYGAWGPPPTAYYASPYAAPVHGYGYGAEYYGQGYGYRGRRCDRGYGYGPRPPYNGGYRPTGYWAPVR
jgi:hypothetical protein